jgi:hypothetical protein
MQKVVAIGELTDAANATANNVAGWQWMPTELKAA